MLDLWISQECLAADPRIYFPQNLNLQRQAVNAVFAGKSSLTNEMITQSKQQTRNTQTTCQKLLCTHFFSPVEEKRTVAGNISQAESQKGVWSKRHGKNNNAITTLTQTGSGTYRKCNGDASKMAMATLPFPLPTLRATFSHSWQNVEQTQTQTRKQVRRSDGAT